MPALFNASRDLMAGCNGPPVAPLPQFRSAQAAGADAHAHLAGSGRPQRPAFDHDLSGALEISRSHYAHTLTLPWSDCRLRQSDRQIMVRVGLVGAIVKSFVTKRRDKKTTLKFLRKSLRWDGQIEGFVTDRLAFDGADLKQRGTINKREVGRWLNHRIGNSHQPF
jgi:hypothetical protein